MVLLDSLMVYNEKQNVHCAEETQQGKGCIMKPSELIRTYADAWRAATHHPFLQGVYDGTLEPALFTTWFVQDYLFVRDEFVAVAHLLTRAPRSAYKVLTEMLVSTEAEISWFEEHVKEQHLSLDTSLLPATESYREFFRNLEQLPYPVVITMFWAVERAYLDAWSNAAYGDPRYRAFVEHWANEDFGRFVQELEQLAEQAQIGSGEYDPLTAALFQQVASLEHAFWEMAYSSLDIATGAETSGELREEEEKPQTPPQQDAP